MYRLFVQMIIVLTFCTGVHASDWDISDVTVIDSRQLETPVVTIADYFRNHLFGDINARYQVGEHHQRANYQVQVGFSEHINHAKMVLSAAYRKQYLQTEYKNHANNSHSNAYEYDEWSIREGYIEFFPIPNSTVSVGKQIIVWGQQSVISPVDLFLPLDVNPVGYSLSKADNRQPLTVLRMNVYPTKKLELIGYYFPQFEPGGLFRYMRDAVSGYDVVMPNRSNESSYAYRAIWYGDLMTLGLTYHNGYNAIPRRKESITTASKAYGYYKRQAVGAELSVPVNGMYFRSEIGIMEDYLLIQTTGLSTAQRQALIRYNSSSNAVPALLSVVSVGLDGDFDSWFMNAYLMKAHYLTQFSNQSFWAAFGAYDHYPNIPMIPSVTVGRYFGIDKSGVYGMSLGYFSGSLGASAFYIQKITSGFSWHASLSYAGSVADLLVDQMNGSELAYVLSEPSIGIGVRQFF